MKKPSYLRSMAENWEGWDGDRLKALQALEQCHGIVSVAAQNCGIGRSTLYRWLEEDPAFKSALESIREAAIDYVESKLFQLIDEKDTGSTIFFLKTRGKKRGYVERNEVSGPDGGPIQVTGMQIL